MMGNMHKVKLKVPILQHICILQAIRQKEMNMNQQKTEGL